MFFPPNVVQDIRALSNSAMDCQALVEIPTGYTRSPGAVTKPTFGNGFTVPCRLSQAAGSPPELLVADAEQVQAAWTVVFDAGTEIREDARLTITGTDATGTPFTLVLVVIGVSGPRSNQAMIFVTAKLAPPAVGA